MNIKSNNINVFPASNRPDGIDINSRYFAEINVLNLINRLTDKPSFVINSSYENNNFQFNIGGYWFNIINLNDLLDGITSFEEGKYLVATINIVQRSNGDGNTPAVNMAANASTQYNPTNAVDTLAADTDEMYTGIDFTVVATLPENTGNTLVLLQKTASGYIIPATSRIKFITNSEGFRSVSIDDGVLA